MSAGESVIAVLEVIHSSYWHTFVCVVLVMMFRPIRVRNFYKNFYKGEDE